MTLRDKIKRSRQLRRSPFRKVSVKTLKVKTKITKQMVEDLNKLQNFDSVREMELKLVKEREMELKLVKEGVTKDIVDKCFNI